MQESLEEAEVMNAGKLLTGIKCDEVERGRRGTCMARRGQEKEEFQSRAAKR